MKQIVPTLLTLLAFSSPVFAVVDIQVIETPKGIKAWLVEDHSLPFVTLDIYFPNGSATDSASQSGATFLMTALLDEGAGELDAVDYQIAVRNIGARFAFETYKQAISVSAKMITENRDESVELLKQAISQPRFEEDDFERVKGQLLTDLRFYSTNPREIGVLAFHDILFGEHPYKRWREGSLETVQALTLEDIAQTHAQAFTRDGVVVGVSGDITKDEIVVLLDELLGELPDKPPMEIPLLEITHDTNVEVVDFPNPQSLIIFGHEAMGRNDPDFLTAYVLNQVFGQSGFNSRLLKKLRVELGLTYGVGSFLSNYRTTGLITGSMQTANDTVPEAIEAIRHEWERIASEGITEDELETIKQYLVGSYPLRFDTNESIAGIMASMLWDEMSPSYVIERNNLVEAIDLETANRVAKKLFQPDQLTFVVVGQPSDPDLL